MAISRQQLVKELEPGLNALFGLEYDKYENEHAEIFDIQEHFANHLSQGEKLPQDFFFTSHNNTVWLTKDDLKKIIKFK